MPGAIRPSPASASPAPPSAVTHIRNRARYRMARKPETPAKTTTQTTVSSTLFEPVTNSEKTLAPITPPATAPTKNAPNRKTSDTRIQAAIAHPIPTRTVVVVFASNTPEISQPSAKPDPSTARCSEPTPKKHSTSPTTMPTTPVITQWSGAPAGGASHPWGEARAVEPDTRSADGREPPCRTSRTSS